MPSLIITVLGPDRPGLVGTVSDVIQQHGGNWLESRMAHLAGQFAGIVQVEVDDDHADQLVGGLRALSDIGLHVVVETDSSTESADESKQLVTLNLIGGDRPGIVREVTLVLAQRSVNVEEFHTECVDAPMSGERLFKATAQLRIPDGLTIEQLQDDVEQIALDLMVDITLAASEK
jgi:glycine cleavage system regulatory protein